MKLAKPLVLSFSLLAFAGAGYAQQGSGTPEQSAQSQPQQSQPQSASAGASAQSLSQMPASEIIGKKVHGAQGEELGEIDDVVIDLQGGRVHAAVLSFGGILGMGEKSYAFPISELKPGKSEGQFTMDVDQQKLENAQGFEKGKWPEMDDEYWGRAGAQQASAGESQPQGQKPILVRASELEGKSVQDKNGADIGEIRDVRLDLSSGKLQDIVLEVEGAGQANVQAQSLTKGTGDQYILSGMDAQQVKQQARPRQ